jgi:hypothetical protein
LQNPPPTGDFAPANAAQSRALVDAPKGESVPVRRKNARTVTAVTLCVVDLSRQWRINGAVSGRWVTAG